MKLVEDWKNCWKWVSMHAMVYAGAIESAWLAFPEQLQALIHPIVAHAIATTILAVGILGRLVNQTKKPSGTA